MTTTYPWLSLTRDDAPLLLSMQQMEIVCRGYMHETPGPVAQGLWPTPYEPDCAAPMRAALIRIPEACLSFATDAT